MTREKEKKLFERYPKLFSGKDKPITENLMPFGFACEDGWFWLIDQLSRNIQHYIDNTHPKPEQVTVSQVKEKYGTLRYYVDYADAHIFGMISFAEHLSGYICERCGSHNARMAYAGTWCKTLCDNCLEEDERYSRESPWKEDD